MSKRIEEKLARDAKEKLEMQKWMQQELETREKLTAEITKHKSVISLLDSDLKGKLTSVVDHEDTRRQLKAKTEEVNLLRNQLITEQNARKADVERLNLLRGELKAALGRCDVDTPSGNPVAPGSRVMTDLSKSKSQSSGKGAKFLVMVLSFFVIRQIMGFLVVQTITGADEL